MVNNLILVMTKSTTTCKKARMRFHFDHDLLLIHVMFLRMDILLNFNHFLSGFITVLPLLSADTFRHNHVKTRMPLFYQELKCLSLAARYLLDLRFYALVRCKFEQLKYSNQKLLVQLNASINVKIKLFLYV